MNCEPKKWQDMTPEEKGALLLARHEGRSIERYHHGEWTEISQPNFNIFWAYRVKPEPKVEVVEICHRQLEHYIRFNMIDGKPDCASIKMVPM